MESDQYVRLALGRLRLRGLGRVEISDAYRILRASIPGVSHCWSADEMMAIIETDKEMLLRVTGEVLEVTHVLVFPEKQSADSGDWLGKTIYSDCD